MKRFAPALFSLVLFLPACQNRLPDVSLPEVPSAPLIQALDAQRRKLVSVKAVARVETERKGKRRSYESVAVVMDRGRLRVDGFGPLGESLFALIWNGEAVLLRPPGEMRFISVGQAGLERALGIALSPQELYAALSGNVIVPYPSAAVRSYCEASGRCLVQFPGDGGDRRVHAFRADGEASNGVIADGEELYSGNKLVYRGRFEERKDLSGYSFPMMVTLENPDRALRLVVRYEDIEVNAPVEDALFQGDAR